MRIGVLALQGAFIEHIRHLGDLGYDAVELRRKEDISSLDGIVFPGGESTTQRKLIDEEGMKKPLEELIESGIPVLGTCAGLILLASGIEGDGEGFFKTLPALVRRNAYGRQSASFSLVSSFSTLGDIPMTFIRAPLILSVGENVEILSRINGGITGVRYLNQYGLTFHPELEKTEDTASVYRMIFKRD